MASYETCFSFFFLLSLSLSLQIQARDSKFFSKYSNSLSPAPSPSLAPALAPESSDVEHGYGLYGRGPVKTADVEAEGFGKESSRDFVMPNSNDYEKKGMSDTRFLENGKYYYDANNAENGIGNEKKEMSEYMEENRYPENEGNGNEAEKKYLVNGKYYSGYVTKSGNGNEKQEMSEYAEDENVFPEKKENGDGYETEETGEKRYFVNGKYYSGYVTGSNNRNGNEKQGMSEYMEDEYASPENKENENRYHESEEQEMGGNRYVEDENRYPESEGNENGYVTEQKEMGEKKHLVNGKYYSGYVTKSGNENENEKQGMREYAEGENSFPENKGNAYEYENQQVDEKKYFVNGKYYNGYVTKSGNGDRNSQNYDNYEDSGAFNEYANRHNEDDFYDRNNEYVREGREQKYGERQNEYAP